VPHHPTALVWSADGVYIAGGAWGWSAPGKKLGPSEIYVIDVGRAAVTITLKVTASFTGPGLAFSPDGKWLAVGTPAWALGAGDPLQPDEPGELAIFDVPAFTRKFTAKPSGAKVGFNDITWSADGKALYVVEGSASYGRDEEKSQVRRWAMPAFTEQPVIRAPESGRYSALAVSADGETLAVVENRGLLRLFDLPKGTERTFFPSGKSGALGWRLVFAADGKAIALFEEGRPYWFDTATGKPAEPKAARVAIQPAGLSDQWCSKFAISPDFSRQIWGDEHHPGLGIGIGGSSIHDGAFIDIKDSATGKAWKWRVGVAKDTGDMPAVAISPDGTKLAGAARQPDGEAIMIWEMPK
jgi:WD40 repeat protein